MFESEMVSIPHRKGLSDNISSSPENCIYTGQFSVLLVRREVLTPNPAIHYEHNLTNQSQSKSQKFTVGVMSYFVMTVILSSAILS